MSRQPKHLNIRKNPYIKLAVFGDRMRSLGKVVSISEGKLILKTDCLVKLGSKLYDEKGRLVGTAVDYFGPTLGPYVVVSPKRSPEPYLGKELYGPAK